VRVVLRKDASNGCRGVVDSAMDCDGALFAMFRETPAEVRVDVFVGLLGAEEPTPSIGKADGAILIKGDSDDSMDRC
jgi:hypothetical protein